MQCNVEFNKGKEGYDISNNNNNGDHLQGSVKIST